MPETRRYTFGEYTLDLERGALLRSGVDVKLRPKSFEVLRLLVQRHGQLVTKEELLKEAWGPVIVTDGAVGQCLIDVRRAIGDEAQRKIRTVPRRGYIFDVPVVVAGGPHDDAQPAPATPPAAAAASSAAASAEVPAVSASVSRTLWKQLVAVTVAIAFVVASWWIFTTRDTGANAPAVRTADGPAVNSIAVLPFVNMSSDREQEYFSDGVSEEILNLLAGTPGLQVIARTSSFSFKGRNVDIAEIASRLNVAYVLEGSVRKAGDRVRITAQLIDTSNSSHLWSNTYDRTLDDIFVVQREIASAVTEALKVELLGDATAVAPRSTQSAEAYQHYLQGQFFYGRRAVDDLERAARHYEEAIAIDPDYARAWAGLAGVRYVQAGTELPMDEALEQLYAAAKKAVALDPNLAEGYVRLSNYYWNIGERAKALEHYDLARKLAPDSPLILAGHAGELAQEGRIDESIAAWKRVRALDPLSALMRNNLASTLYAAGRLEEARQEYLRALELNPDNDSLTIAFILLLRREFDEAERWLQKRVTGFELDQGMAMVHHARGRRAESDAALVRLTGAVAAYDPFRIAEVEAYRGNVDAAFRWLDAVLQGDTRFDGTLSKRKYQRFAWEMQRSPFLAPLHGDPRWKSWLERLEQRSQIRER